MNYLVMIASTLMLVAFLELGHGIPKVSLSFQKLTHGLGALFVVMMHAFAKTGICFAIAAIVWSMATS